MDFGLLQKRDSLCCMSCLQAKNMQDLTRRKEIHTFRIMLVKAAFQRSANPNENLIKVTRNTEIPVKMVWGQILDPFKWINPSKTPRTTTTPTQRNIKKKTALKKTDFFVRQRESEEGTWVLAATGAGGQQRQATRPDVLRCNGLKVKAQVKLSQETAARGALGAQPGWRRLTTHLQALTHFAILYEKHVERD